MEIAALCLISNDPLFLTPPPRSEAVLKEIRAVPVMEEVLLSPAYTPPPVDALFPEMAPADIVKVAALFRPPPWTALLASAAVEPPMVPPCMLNVALFITPPPKYKKRLKTTNI